MGKKYLVDTNVVIDFFGYRLSKEATLFVSTIQPIISFITQIELFATERVTSDETVKLISFINDAVILGITTEIIDQTIKLRRINRVKLPDAIIAATALANGFTLLTRNTNDFKSIVGLELLNPYLL